jgi:hypothetical protein
LPNAQDQDGYSMRTSQSGSLKPEAIQSALRDSGLSSHRCVDAWSCAHGPENVLQFSRVATVASPIPLSQPPPPLPSYAFSPTAGSTSPTPSPSRFFDDLLPSARTSQFRPTNSIDEGHIARKQLSLRQGRHRKDHHNRQNSRLPRTPRPPSCRRRRQPPQPQPSARLQKPCPPHHRQCPCGVLSTRPGIRPSPRAPPTTSISSASLRPAASCPSRSDPRHTRPARPRSSSSSSVGMSFGNGGLAWEGDPMYSLDAHHFTTLMFLA